jgi:hypothetical protein
MFNLTNDREEAVHEVIAHAERMSSGSSEAERIGQFLLESSPECISLGAGRYDVDGVVEALEFLVGLVDLVE